MLQKSTGKKYEYPKNIYSSVIMHGFCQFLSQAIKNHDQHVHLTTFDSPMIFGS